MINVATHTHTAGAGFYRLCESSKRKRKGGKTKQNGQRRCVPPVALSPSRLLFSFPSSVCDGEPQSTRKHDRMRKAEGAWVRALVCVRHMGRRGGPTSPSKRSLLPRPPFYTANADSKLCTQQASEGGEKSLRNRQNSFRGEGIISPTMNARLSLWKVCASSSPLPRDDYVVSFT